ncbi:MAG: hypothetical protein V1894_03505 [Chloroflexota bacterium]
MEDEREIRLTIDEFEAALKKAKIITSKEEVHESHIEPGELVIKVRR